MVCDRGTILGRDVVPDVCSTRAQSSGPAGPPFGAGEASAGASAANRKSPAAAPAAISISSTASPCFAAANRAGDVEPASTTSALAFKSERVNSNSSCR